MTALRERAGRESILQAPRPCEPEPGLRKGKEAQTRVCSNWGRSPHFAEEAQIVERRAGDAPLVQSMPAGAGPTREAAKALGADIGGRAVRQFDC
jgi:hypothetical protein